MCEIRATLFATQWSLLKVIRRSPTYSVVRSPDGRENTVSTAERVLLLTTGRTHRIRQEEPTEFFPESDHVGGNDIGDVAAEEADGLQGEREIDESSVPEDVVSDSVPTLPNR